MVCSCFLLGRHGTLPPALLQPKPTCSAMGLSPFSAFPVVHPTTSLLSAPCHASQVHAGAAVAGDQPAPPADQGAQGTGEGWLLAMHHGCCGMCNAGSLWLCCRSSLQPEARPNAKSVEPWTSLQ